MKKFLKTILSIVLVITGVGLIYAGIKSVANNNTTSNSFSKPSTDKDLIEVKSFYVLEQYNDSNNENYEVNLNQYDANWYCFFNYTVNYGCSYRIRIDTIYLYENDVTKTDKAYSNETFEYGWTGTGAFFYYVGESDPNTAVMSLLENDEEKIIKKFSNGLFFLNLEKEIPLVEIDIEENEVVYNDDLPTVKVPEGVTYDIYYSSQTLNIDRVEKPSAEGNWTLHVNTYENYRYKATSITKDFEYKYTIMNTTLLTPLDDMWGAGGNSVVVKADNMKYVATDKYSYYEGTLGKDENYITSAYMLSKYYYSPKGSFNVKAKTNLTDFGTFAFWLTTCNGDAKSTGGEYTIEVLGNKKLVLAYVDSNNDYKDYTLNIDVDLTDNKYHDYTIKITDDGFGFFIDGKEYKIPDLEDKGYLYDKMNAEYVRVNCGLLYPQNPKWTGEVHGDVMPSCRITEAKYLNENNSSK